MHSSDNDYAALVECTDLVAGYGSRAVLDSVSIHVRPGEVVALIGHNGAGKSTLLKALFGVLPIQSGRISFAGVPPGRPKPRHLARAGIAYLPQGGAVFRNLTVMENLLARVDGAGRRGGVDQALDLFPRLKALVDRPARELSGGERQLLSLAGAAATSPRLMLMDEPSLGLAPVAARRTLAHIREVATGHEHAALIVEQRVRDVLAIADRVYVLRNGGVSFEGPSEDLTDQARLREVFL